MEKFTRKEFQSFVDAGRGKRTVCEEETCLLKDAYGVWKEVKIVEDKPTPLHDEVIKEIQNMNQEMDDILTRMVSDLDLMIKNAKYGNAIMKRTIKVITEGQG